MFRVTIMGRDLKEFQENLRDYANVHAGIHKELVKQSVELSTTVDEDDEMEEVESPFTESTPVKESKPTTVPHVIDSGVTGTITFGGELDSEGIPWDERIHASSKAKVGNGTWRLKRNVDENLVYQIKSYYRNSTSVKETAPTTSVDTPAPVETVVENTPVVSSPVVAAPTPAAPLPQMGQGHTLDTFKANFPMILASLITQKKIDQEYVNQLKTFFNINEIWMANDEQKSMVFDQFVEYGFIQKVG